MLQGKQLNILFQNMLVERGVLGNWLRVIRQ
jgi:hypothetical protein